MKVALFIQNADRRAGGAEGYTLDLARALTARGHEITIVAEHGPPEVAQDALASGFKCIYLGAKGLYRWARLQDFLERLKGVYDSGAYDVVHAMLAVRTCDVYQPHSGLAMDSWLNGHLKYPQWLLRRWARRFNYFNIKRRGLARLERQLMRHKPWVLCSSAKMRDLAQEYFSAPAFPTDHLVPLMNGIDLNYFDPARGTGSRKAIREEWHVEPDQCLGLLVGSNLKLKGAQDAVEALARVKDRRMLLMIVGREDPAAYKRQAARLGVSDRIRFAGRVGDLRTLYGAADFLLLPTRRDTCSLVVLEALAMGLPVITTLQNGASEVIEDGRQGILLNRGNPGTLAEALIAMLDDDCRRAMSCEAVAMRYTLSYEHHVEKIEGVYRQVLQQREQSGSGTPLKSKKS